MSQKSLDEIRNDLMQYNYSQPILKRCNKCILPTTFPFIEFDDSGVCNICNNYEKYKLENIMEFNDKVERFDI